MFTSAICNAIVRPNKCTSVPHGITADVIKLAVMAVGGQALGGSVPGGSSQFEVVVSIPELDEVQMRQVRLGMSAKLSILTYHNPEALVVPAAAMRRAGDKWLLDYRSAPQHPGSVVEVEAGRSMPDGLEVFGLEPGYVRVAN